MRLGIDAVFLRYGGELTYLREMLVHADFRPAEIESIVVVAPQWVLDALPERDFLIKQSFPWLNRNRFWILKSQVRMLDQFFQSNADVLMSVTGEYTGKFRPLIAVSQSLNVFERDYWKDWWKLRDFRRQWLSLRRHLTCLEYSGGIIFLSRYAQHYLTGILPLEKKKSIVSGIGVSAQFALPVKPQRPIAEYTFGQPFRWLYVSGIQPHKNHPELIESIDRLRKKGYPLELIIVGRIMYTPSGRRLKRAMRKFDPEGTWIFYQGVQTQDEVIEWYRRSDAFVFASSGVTMPSSVYESMAAGLPVVCSDKQPLPEFVKDNGFFFRAGDVDSMAQVIEKMLTNPDRREHKAQRAKAEMRLMDWRKPVIQTYEFLLEFATQQKDVLK